VRQAKPGEEPGWSFVPQSEAVVFFCALGRVVLTGQPSLEFFLLFFWLFLQALDSKGFEKWHFGYLFDSGYLTNVCLSCRALSFSPLLLD
jgi:hypothetical protein